MVALGSPEDEVDCASAAGGGPSTTSTLVAGVTPGPTGSSVVSATSPKGNSSPPSNSSVSADTVLATAGYDHTIKLWQIHTALCVKTFQHPDSQVNDLKITPDRKLVGAAGFQHVRIYDVHGSSQSPMLNFEGLSKNVTTIGFNKDAQWMFSGGEDCYARIWDLRTNSTQKLFHTHSHPVTCATLHPDNTQLIIGDQNGTIHVWDLRNDRNEQRIPEQSAPVAIQHVAIDPLGNYLAAVNNRGYCYVWSLEASGEEEDCLKLEPFHKVRAHSRYALRCCFSNNSKYLATTSADQTCKIWDLSERGSEPVQVLQCTGQRWVWSVAFTGDSQYVVTASSDNLARLWSVDSGQIKREYNGHQKPVTCIAYRDPSMVY